MSSNIDAVHDRLDRVLDPCSCLTDRPLSIVELGLIEHVEVEDGSVTIELVPTSPVCLYMAQIVEEVEAEVGALDTIDEVSVTPTTDILWRPERMDDGLWREKRASAETRLSEVASK